MHRNPLKRLHAAALCKKMVCGIQKPCIRPQQTKTHAALSSTPNLKGRRWDVRLEKTSWGRDVKVTSSAHRQASLKRARTMSNVRISTEKLPCGRCRPSQAMSRRENRKKTRGLAQNEPPLRKIAALAAARLYALAAHSLFEMLSIVLALRLPALFSARKQRRTRCARDVTLAWVHRSYRPSWEFVRYY